jgi:hypothetical protein
MFPLCYRRCQLPRKATLAKRCLICNIWHFRDGCAMFLDFSLLEAVRHFRFHLEVCCSNHTVMLRSQNNYITSVLILFVLASVCQSNSRFVVGTNTNYADGDLCGGSSICSGTHGLCSTGQDSVVRFVRHDLVPLLFTSSKKFHIFRIWFSTSAVTDISIALALLWQLSRIKSPFKATQRCVSSYY